MTKARPRQQENPYGLKDIVVLLEHVDDAASNTLTHYQERGGYEAFKKAHAMSPGEVTTMVRNSGLRGRGGAGFPTGFKWGFIPPLDKKPGPRYVCVNADESEPGTFMDRKLMECDPHQVLEGTMICCWAIGAHDAYIYIRGEMVLGAERLNMAIQECYDAGILGPDAMGTGFRIDITVHRGAGAYICGEETGLISSLEGGRGYPKLKPPFPAVEGAWKQPTIVNNVETLANVPHMINRGLDWYQNLGTPPQPKSDKFPRGRLGSRGPKLVCLSGHVNNPGLYEIEMGTSLKDIIYDDMWGGGMLGGRKLKAVVPGGSSMKILTADEIDVPFCYDALMDAGTSLGSAGIIVMDESTCMVNALLNLMRFYAHESCGQCTPCREGSGWMKKVVHRIEHGMGTPEDLDLINAIAKQACGKTICVMAEAFSWPAESYIQKFRDEFEKHIRLGQCPSGGKLCDSPL
jgi:NADH-quinone oxidoreductase subunit F